jgi:cytidylate kinase
MGDDGDVVILGRGSQYILNDHPDAYHILLIDTFENRVRFMQKNYDLSQGRAAQVVKNEDKRRVNLYRKLGKSDYDNPILYHLVLNMSKVDLKQALELVCQLAGSRK